MLSALYPVQRSPQNYEYYGTAWKDEEEEEQCAGQVQRRH